MARPTSTTPFPIVESVYEKCANRGLILPILNESGWSDTTRATLYFIGLLYCFLGVAILADVFMCAIERITSSKRKVKLKPGEVPDAEDGSTVSEYKEVLVWNPTVANLTLMALGSSSPEILLSIIEIVGNNFHAGDLGPGTIVGSAAYNLLVITAVCIITIPNGETKRIESILVFIVTTVWATFAYIWLIIILLGFSPGVVEVWEAALTLGFFFALVITAYLADIKICDRWRRKQPNQTATDAGKAIPLQQSDTVHLGEDDVTHPLQSGKEDFVLRWRDPQAHKFQYHPEWREIQRACARQYPNLPPEELAKLVAYRIEQTKPHDRLWYRILATRQFASAIKRREYFDPAFRPATDDLPGAGLRPSDSVSLGSGTLQQGSRKASLTQYTSYATPVSDTGTLVVRGKRFMVVEMSARVYVVDPKSQDRVRLQVIRRGRTHKKVMFRYETLNGTAKRNTHYLHKSETLVFQPGETEKMISVDLVGEGGEWSENDMFYVKLELDPTMLDERVKLGQANPAEIVYLPKEPEPVQVEFLKPNAVVKESEGVVRLAVVRKGSSKDEVVVDWSTADITAQHSKDYEGANGQLRFAEGEREKYLDVTVIDDIEVEKTETFAVTLTDTSRGTTGTNKRAIVTIVNDDKTSRFLTKLDQLVPRVLDSLTIGGRSWYEQILGATSVNDGDVGNATLLDCITHVISFPWKVICALIPPPRIWGGWLAFVVALAMIGVLTAIIGDLASIFGCTIGLSDSVTAITFVALGTSLPDTFASRVAAIMDRNADNAIGNVTGSNSVNVFLGLGLPWFVASIVWAVRGQPFQVMKPDAAIGFSVTIYTIFSLFCIALLFARRYLPIFGRAELGGPTLTKWLCAIFLVFLWFLYILLSSLQAHHHIKGF